MSHYCGFSSCPSVVCKVKLEHKKYSNNASFYYFIVINIILVYVLHDVTQKKTSILKKHYKKLYRLEYVSQEYIYISVAYQWRSKKLVNY